MQDVNFWFFYFYSSRRLRREENFYQGSMWPSKGRWVEEVNQRNLPAKDCYSFGKLLWPQTEFLIGQFSSTCQSQAKWLHFPIAEKEGRLTLLKMKFLIFSLRATTPCVYKGWFFFFLLRGVGGRGQLNTVFTCSSEHGASHAFLDYLLLTLYMLTSVCIFSILFSRHFQRGWRGEFV